MTHHKELEQMLKGKKVFAPVKRSDVLQSRVIRSHMFLKYKYDDQGKLKTEGKTRRWQ